MSDEIPIVPNRDDATFRDLRSDVNDQRAFFSPHAIIDNGRIRFVHPAVAMTLGSMCAKDSTDYLPTLRIDSAFSPLSLMFVPTGAELRALGQAMIDTAARMEAEADDMLAAALKRGKGA